MTTPVSAIANKRIAERSQHRNCLSWLLFLASLIFPTFFYGGNRDWSWTLSLMLSSIALWTYLSSLQQSGVLLRDELNSIHINRRRALGYCLLGWFLYVFILPLILHFSVAVAMQGADFLSYLRTAGKSLWYLQIFVLTLLLHRSSRRLRWTLHVLFWVALLHAVLATVLHLTGQRISSSFFVFNPINASGAFVNRNHFAGYLELHLAIGAGLLLSGLKFRSQSHESWRQVVRDLTKILLSKKAQARLGLIVMVVALVVTQSRAGNGAFFIALIATGVLATLIMRHRPPALPWLVLSLILFDLLVVGTWFGADRIAERISATRLDYSQSQGQTANAVLANTAASVPQADLSSQSNSDLDLDRERPAVTKATLELWRQAPWFGHGGDSFRLLFPAVRPLEMSGSYYDHAHNDWAQWIMEFGIIGTLISAFWLMLCVRAAIRALRKSGDRLACGIAFSCLLGISSLLMHGLFDFNLQIPANAAMFSFLMALGWLSLYGLRERSKHESEPSRPTASELTRPVRAKVLLTLVSILALTACATKDKPAPTSVEAVPEKSLQASQSVLSNTPSLTCQIGRPDYSAGNLALSEYRDMIAKLDKSLSEQARKQRLVQIALQIIDNALRLQAISQNAKAQPYWRALSSEFVGLKWRLAETSKAGNKWSAWALQELNLAEKTWSEKDCQVLIGNAPPLLESNPMAAHLRYRMASCLSGTAQSAALEWMKKSAEDGHPAAEEAIGRLCAGEKSGRVCAVEYLCKAADAGRASAAGLAGYLLTEERPSTGNAVRAAALYEMAVAAGDAASANNLGELYEMGWIGKQDLAQALYWYELGAEKNLPEAQLNLARLLLMSNDVEQRQQALTWLARAAQYRPTEVLKMKERFGIAEQR